MILYVLFGTLLVIMFLASVGFDGKDYEEVPTVNETQPQKVNLEGKKILEKVKNQNQKNKNKIFKS